MRNSASDHLFWVDFLRGLAAVAILLWHYQHFYMPSPGVSLLTDRSAQPFFDTLKLFYTHGLKAVHLFWVISGFVFANIYATSAAAVTAGDFFVNRFARLYPLHFVTLLVVALLQTLALLAVGHYQIYPANNLYHFILNLFFASSWGLEYGLSFNAPIWSVSIEVLIYAVFFVSIPLVANRFFSAPLIAVAFLTLHLTTADASCLALCGLFFFVGCSAFSLWRSLGHRMAPLAGVSGIGLAMLTNGLAFELIAFPSLVLSAAALDRLDTVGLGSKISVLGDLTYSSYLWHVPIQVAALTVIELFAIDRAIVSSHWFFAMFFASVFAISLLSFNYLEKPARRAIRNYHQHHRRKASIGACEQSDQSGEARGTDMLPLLWNMRGRANGE